MDLWTETYTAYRLAIAGTVSKAAADLGVHRATVNRHIDALEAAFSDMKNTTLPVPDALMARVMEELSKRIGVRIASGFNERVIFRELFPRGLTLLDLKDLGVTQLNISNVAARQELRDLMSALNLPGVTVDF